MIGSPSISLRLKESHSSAHRAANPDARGWLESMASMSGRSDLRKAVEKYNTFRPHHALKGKTPMEYIRITQLASCNLIHSQAPTALRGRVPLRKNDSRGFLCSWLIFQALCSPINLVWFKSAIPTSHVSYDPDVSAGLHRVQGLAPVHRVRSMERLGNRRLSDRCGK